MADRHGHRDGLLGPVIPVVDMQIGAANGRALDLDEYVVDAQFRVRDVFEPDAFAGFFFYQCFHWQVRYLGVQR